MKKISAQSGSALGGKNKNKFRKKILASAYCSLFLMCVFLIFSSSIAHASATVDTNSQCANSGGTFVPNALTVPCQNCPSGKVTGAGGGYICQTPADFAASTSSTSPAADVYSATAGTASQGQTLFSSSTPTQFTYTLLESLPGFYSANTPMTDLPGLILAIYKFGIWTVGIAGLFMLVVGGIMYMSSAGNTSTASSAQGIITDALIGIVAALGAYLILYVINPDFTKINLNFTSVNVSDYGGPTGTGNPNPESTNCTSDTILAKIKSASQGKLDPGLTFALLNTESGCDASTPNSSANACGIAQMLPGTAGVSCDTLRSNVDLSISTGIQYFLSNSTKIRGSISGTFASNGNSFKQAAEDLYAAYNGGAGALANSVDCAGGTNGFGFPFKAWDCTVNPGGYVQTQAAAPRFLNSYLACNADANLQAKLK